MIRVLLDTNIIIDFLNDRQPFSLHAADIFRQGRKKSIELFTSSHSFATTHYIMKKLLPEKELRSALTKLNQHIQILPVTEKEIQHALSTNHQDFEDSIQIFTALNGNIDYIVTRNIKDFQKSPVKVNTPDQLLQSLIHSST
jgi:predicted nucleic acid-binding protein